MNDLPERVWPGLTGSVGALLWIRATSWPRRGAMVLLGAAMSYYAGPFMAQVFALDASTSGFFLGLFGMSLVDWVFRTADSLGMADIIRAWVKKRLGVE